LQFILASNVSLRVSMAIGTAQNCVLKPLNLAVGGSHVALTQHLLSFLVYPVTYDLFPMTLTFVELDQDRVG